MRSPRLKQVKKHTFKMQMAKKPLAMSCSIYYYAKSQIKQAANQRQKLCPEKAIATERRQYHQMINKCTGFGTRMSWIRMNPTSETMK